MYGPSSFARYIIQNHMREPNAVVYMMLVLAGLGKKEGREYF